MSASTEPPYAVGDTILVEQGSKLHDAKVLMLGDGQVAGQDVFVHYLGWNKKWDSWALLEHTRPVTADSRAEQARMEEEFKQKQNKSSKKQKSREEAGIGRAAKTQSASEAAAEALEAAAAAMKSDEELMSSDLVPPLPSTLRRRLVLDWERLTRKYQIQRLPARLPVLTILAAFLHDHQASKAHEAAADAHAAQQDAVMQVCEGLLCYFERCLPAILLYRIERPQMQQLAEQHGLTIAAPGEHNASPLFSLQHLTQTLPRPPAAVQPSSSLSSSSASTTPESALQYWLPAPSADSEHVAVVVRQWSGVYGVEHLVRMLCKLPAMLRGAETEWEQEQRQAVRYTLTALYRWLSSHDELIYGYSGYEKPEEDYMYKLQQPHHTAPLKDEPPQPLDEQHKPRTGHKTVDMANGHSPSKAGRTLKRERR